MSPLSPVESARLAKFIAVCLAPVADTARTTSQSEAAGLSHQGVARACLASRFRWETGDLAFLRVMAAWPVAEPHEMTRLLQLIEIGREQTR